LPDRARLNDLIHALFSHYPPQNWWPARTRFEVIAGAILVQNTAWTNVEHALQNLRRAGVLGIAGVRNTSLSRLEELVRPSGFFRQKALRLKSFVAFLDANYRGSLQRMFRTPTDQLRIELLGLHGIGPETADSILLYAGRHPVFIVDAYTRRVFERHRLFPANVSKSYDEIRFAVEDSVQSLLPLGARGAGLPRHAASPISRASFPLLSRAYNELHAMIVRVGVDHCRTKPDCVSCPLKSLL
jgi:endonuclease III related protein